MEAGKNTKLGYCWLPNQISEVINTMNAGIGADGDGTFRPSSSEMPDRN